MLKFRITLLSILSFITVTTAALAQLPPINLKYSSFAIDTKGAFIGYLGEPHRVELKYLNNMSPYVIKSLIATEDRDFYNHNGVSVKALGRAAIATVFKGASQGGSTITMQLVKNLFLTNEKTLDRKVKQIDLALEFEKHYSKDQILLMYLNTVYFGSGAYGVWAAAQEYYSKDPMHLTIAEAAMIVGLLQSPEGYNPNKKPEKALNRRNIVLKNLLDVGVINEKEYKTQKSKKLDLKPRTKYSDYFIDYIRFETAQTLARQGQSLENGPFRVICGYNDVIQKTCSIAIEEFYKKFPANMQSAQIGLAVIENRSGQVKALVGGNPSSNASGMNHSCNMRRQVGSSFKPILYSTLIEKGFNLAFPLQNKQMEYQISPGNIWRPENSDEEVQDTIIPMRYAIQKSVNQSAAFAILNLTTPKEVSDFARRLGIKGAMQEYPSLALGTLESNPLEMAKAYSVFANYGYYNMPHSVLKIEKDYNKVFELVFSDHNQSLDSANCYLITNAMQTVVDSGTAKSIRNYYKGVCAGKTGTTQNSKDAWFVGYTPEYTIAIWMGFDDYNMSLKAPYRYGGTACAPIWGKIASDLVKAKVINKNIGFTVPSSIKFMNLCEDNGEIANGACKRTGLYPVRIVQDSLNLNQGIIK